MDDITTEQKLHLARQIRSQYYQNQRDMSDRERILYGSCGTYISQAVETTQPNINSESLKCRSAIAFMIFAFVVLFDFWGIQPAKINMEQVFELIAADYKDEFVEYVETVSSEIKNSH
jgi:hypothetical protein